MIIGVDIGTSGIRALSFDEKTETVLGKCVLNHKTFFPKPDHAEQNPDEILSNLIRCVDDILGDFEGEVVISLSSILHSVVALNDRGERTTNLMIWADRRAKSEKEFLKKELGSHFFYSRTGCPLHPMYLPSKILWIRNHVDNAKKFMSIKSYIVHRLTGKTVEDLSVASASGLLNLEKRSWDEDILNVLGIDESNLPEIVSPYTTYSVNGVFRRNAILVMGAGDGMLANLGVGAFSEDTGVLTLGTSGAVRVLTDRVLLDKDKNSTWCYMLDENTYTLGAAVNSGGIVLEWLRNLFKLEEIDLVISKVENVKAGSDGLIFLPFINGERSPNWREDYRGVIIGLTSSHDTTHIFRSAMEGIAFRMRAILESVERVHGSPFRKILATGGFTRSEIFSQLVSNVIGRKMELTNIDENVAFGATLMGMKALGMNWDEALKKIRIVKTIVPDEREKRIYEDLYSRHLHLYELLKDVWTTKGG